MPECRRRSVVRRRSQTASETYFAAAFDRGFWWLRARLDDAVDPRRRAEGDELRVADREAVQPAPEDLPAQSLCRYFVRWLGTSSVNLITLRNTSIIRRETPNAKNLHGLR